jgi:glycosyltransferase involved in cell wall biosynthesis
VTSKYEVYKRIDKADVIQIMHSYPEFLAYAVSRKKRIFVYHTGTNYRMNSKGMNTIFNDYVERSFTDQCEFMGLNAKNLTYIATAIDTDKFRQNLRPADAGKVIGHFPSNKVVKGTDKILEMLGNLTVKYDLNYSTLKVGHKQQLNRMKDCDIYIEMFAPMQGNHTYGCYGVTAFEAAAMGKVVITNNNNQTVYHNAYGECALRIVNTENEFMHELNYLLGLESHVIKEIQSRSRQWVLEKHSYQATGEYLKKFL